MHPARFLLKSFLRAGSLRIIDNQNSILRLFTLFFRLLFPFRLWNAFLESYSDSSCCNAKYRREKCKLEWLSLKKGKCPAPSKPRNDRPRLPLPKPFPIAIFKRYNQLDNKSKRES
ncbi:MAG: hypothetical protein C4527_18460 [Candidatus Omnitrophota bacterium]|nr:MAG: hypothetical protein C4527_18460 [Candidatus Omnitrophota bacterium]